MQPVWGWHILFPFAVDGRGKVWHTEDLLGIVQKHTIGGFWYVVFFFPFII